MYEAEQNIYHYSQYMLSEIQERDNQINQCITERDNAIAERDNAIAERDNAITERDNVFCSKSWRITAPLREVKNILKGFLKGKR